jgi:hypothetical protein
LLSLTDSGYRWLVGCRNLYALSTYSQIKRPKEGRRTAAKGQPKSSGTDQWLRREEQTTPISTVPATQRAKNRMDLTSGNAGYLLEPQQTSKVGGAIFACYVAI